jgi:radical SAM family uncharacterized protein
MATSPAADLWGRVEPLLARVERPARYLDREWAARHVPDAAYRVALHYPDTYELGMANQAIGILYERLNALEGVAAERVYLPWKDMAAEMRAAGVPLFTLESCLPVASCDLLGITLPYELAYVNVLEALDLAGIPLRAAERSDCDALVVGGGPCVYNPEPVAAFFDAILIGEGEEAVAEIVAVHRAALAEGASRAETLRRLAAVRGVYVPSLYEPETDGGGDVGFAGMRALDGAPPVVVKRVIADLDTFPPPVCPVVPFMDVVHDRATVEVLRGCSRGCRFCQAGMVYRPVRERSADSVVRDVLAALACSGYEEVSLTSLSSTDHSRIEEIVRRLSRRLEGTAVSVSLPSLRVDAFGVGLARLLSRGKKAGLTLAPEAGTQRLRDAINKGVTEDDLLDAVRVAFDAGWHRVKLYFMIGLPTETDEDVAGIGALVSRVLQAARDAMPPEQRGSLRVAVSVSTFVPKAHTPFQWDPQLTLEEVRRRQEVLRAHMPRRGVELSWHDADVSFLEGALARGGRELAGVVENAWRAGAAFSAWTEEFDLAQWLGAFAAARVDPVSLASGERDAGRQLPWAHISAGVSAEFLADERRRADSGELTPDCTFDECGGCGACPALGADVVLAGERHG